MTSSVQKVWTFVILGGHPFDLSLPQNPSLNYDGKRTIWKLVGTLRLSEMAREIIEGQGASVKKFTEEQSEEQAQQRLFGPEQ